ncbi:MAG: glycine cleavage system protein GcvH [Deltaproteobacteria bacterium]|nr:glycine cleavage system protein GcvH [Deltaproteobacteria bacterium]
MQVPKDLKYTKDHEWARVEGSAVIVGITDYAQDKLGDVVFVEIENDGTQLKQHEKLGTVESVKSVSDVFSPLSGRIVEVNKDLLDHPELVNKDPYGRAWMVRLAVDNIKGELDGLLDPDAYERYCKEAG